MPAYTNIRDRLPSLYRPEAGDLSPLSLLLQAIGEVLDDLQADSVRVMQAHWLSQADAAVYSEWVRRGRVLAALPPLQAIKRDPASGKRVKDPDAIEVIEEHPYIHDLAYVAGLLPLSPWFDPSSSREKVEAYRQRIKRVMAIYRNGLGTVGALRRVVEAELPIDESQPLDRHDQPFWIEEFAPLAARQSAATTRGAPDGMLGPLMRWPVENTSLYSSAPTVIVEAVAEAERPMIEQYKQKVGLAYTGTLAAGQALRFQPSFASWLGTEAGVEQAAHNTDPTAAGGWAAAAGAPAASVTALIQSADLTLWAGTADGELWRSDGTNWSQATDGLGAIHCLHEAGMNLLIGSESGLSRMPLYPPGGGPFTATPLAALAGVSVHAFAALSNGELWLATAGGTFTLAGDSATPTPLQGVETYAIYEEESGVRYFGTALGVFLHQPGPDRWYFYSGLQRSEQHDEWLPWEPGPAPDESEIGLPPVRAIQGDQAGGLWLGTDNGLARYVARAGRPLTYETLLEAFPDLTGSRVFFIRRDARGILWFGTGAGLFRYDGRQMWQRQDNRWVQLGHADQAYVRPLTPSPRGAWRFDRPASRWAQFSTQDFAFDVDDPAHLRGKQDEAAVQAVAWTNGVTAEVGTFDGTSFTATAPVPAGELECRFKPDNTRIIAGGIPALPSLPTGQSTWRYLSREPEAALLPPAPAWTSEGRLLPPPELEEANVGRYEMYDPPPDSVFDDAVFAYPPVVKVTFQWPAAGPLAVLVRLLKRTADQQFDPVVVERVWQGMQRVRPAGVRFFLAIEEEIVKEPA